MPYYCTKYEVLDVLTFSSLVNLIMIISYQRMYEYSTYLSYLGRVRTAHPRSYLNPFLQGPAQTVDKDLCKSSYQRGKSTAGCTFSCDIWKV